MKEISLTNSPLVTLVDDDDFELLSESSWHLGPKGYVRRSQWFAGKRWKISLSRVVMNAPDETEVDHVNHDTLDNRKQNLRLATVAQNQWNQLPRKTKTYSPLKGVTFQASGNRKKPWLASIRINGRHKFLGYFATQEEAALAYKIAAQDAFGEFART